jgi:hypothetical protein
MTEPSRPLALLRVGLGTAPVMAATVTLYLLLMIGMTDVTIWATVVTLALVVLSRVLFQNLDWKG